MPRILVIDDDSGIRQLLSQFLTMNGFEVDETKNGKQSFTGSIENYYDLIITDIIMPNYDGIETIMDIRKQSKSLPIIAMSGGGRIGPDNYLIMAKQFGANFAFEKPVELAKLLAAVKSCLANR